MISAIGSVVAAIGVIPSLIYLAVQIREQNKERHRAGINILTAQWGDLVKPLYKLYAAYNLNESARE
jgi:hypothetical protein